MLPKGTTLARLLRMKPQQAAAPQEMAPQEEIPEEPSQTVERVQQARPAPKKQTRSRGGYTPRHMR